ncbi:hypothetical protein LDENG_00006620 [Lucifuga dentata]|nr:hypothetical protein LDENG_00006620 [Lucifuga dentata]
MTSKQHLLFTAPPYFLILMATSIKKATFYVPLHGQACLPSRLRGLLLVLEGRRAKRNRAECPFTGLASDENGEDRKSEIGEADSGFCNAKR